MKKIAILTLYYKNYNFGGLLQAYALQQFLQQKDSSVKQISYVLESGYLGYSRSKKALHDTLARFYHYLRFGLWQYEFDKRRRKFDVFAQSIPHTKVVTAYTIRALNEEYDYFIFGSDQIWNPIGWQPVLLGDFVENPKKKISYAASVSRESLTDEEYDILHRYLLSFSMVSVREKNTIEKLNERYSDLKVRFVPDPVFLLNKNHWMSIIINGSLYTNELGSNYILCYFLGTNTENRDKAIAFSKKIGKRVLFFSHYDKHNYQWEHANKDILSGACGPRDFIRYILMSDMVITDSFHGVAFSLIFEKPFVCLQRFRDNDKKSMNSRIISLLSDFNMEYRFCKDIASEIDYEYSQSEIDDLRRILIEYQNVGREYLKKALN